MKRRARLITHRARCPDGEFGGGNRAADGGDDVQTARMTHPVWPLFDLVVRTPRLELHGITDEVALQLAQLAAEGIHDPAFMPFAIEWTDVPSPQLERNTMQYYWRCRAELSPRSWSIDLAVLVDGELVGTTGLIAKGFPTLRTFESGSWLGRRFQGAGIGTEMRLATLQLGFDGLGAQVATTTAFGDNEPSLGVTRKLRYRPQGSTRRLRRGAPAESHLFDMTYEDWAERLRRDDIVIDGIEAARDLLGLSAG